MTIDQDLFLECYQSKWFARLCYVGRHASDGDDIRQEAAIALMRAIQSWNPARGVPLKQFACVCIRRQLSKAKQGLRSIVKTPGEYSIRTGEIIDDIMADVSRDDWLDPADKARLQARMEALSDRERLAVELVALEGQKPVEAAAVMGISRQRVLQLTSQAVAKLAPTAA